MLADAEPHLRPLRVPVEDEDAQRPALVCSPASGPLQRRRGELGKAPRDERESLELVHAAVERDRDRGRLLDATDDPAAEWSQTIAPARPRSPRRAALLRSRGTRGPVDQPLAVVLQLYARRRLGDELQPEEVLEQRAAPAPRRAPPDCRDTRAAGDAGPSIRAWLGPTPRQRAAVGPGRRMASASNAVRWSSSWTGASGRARKRGSRAAMTPSGSRARELHQRREAVRSRPPRGSRCRARRWASSGRSSRRRRCCPRRSPPAVPHGSRT